MAHDKVLTILLQVTMNASRSLIENGIFQYVRGYRQSTGKKHGFLP